MAPSASAGQWPQGAQSPQPSLAPMLEKVTPAVVNISSEQPIARPHGGFPSPGGPFAPPERAARSLGSGVIVDAANGYVLTNHHVIRNGQSITVTLQDGRDLNASVIGSDPATDLALLRVNASGLQALPLADSSELRVGDYVVAVGNPFGLGQAATSGIVSAIDRSGLQKSGYQSFIQTDASINPGSSGGALVDLRGELVGINTMIYTPSGGNVGIGFAVPSDVAASVMQDLLEHGKVRRGNLGLDTFDLSARQARSMNLPNGSSRIAVTGVQPQSPAQKAGVQTGDIVLALNGKAVRTANELRNLEGLLPLGSTATLAVQRDGKQHTLSLEVTAAERQRLHAGELDKRLNGIGLSDPGDTSQSGVTITSLYPERSAAAARLRQGDVLLSINHAPVSRVGDVRTLLKNAQLGQQLLLSFSRKNRQFYLLLN
ncbi:trypsin-like peptidase domain-containing protein [Paenalcaligenes niemegkensis]|uniref:trypsin-like peptidase domain-containing protein n=1 Tax=Paenalcaligenes niemegkensis TaxID=2895469 RepID=UPI001EE86AFD|nr:trypsin-like peptidase domain-containing protein [Paenalcaligenes niemegkensis]MCQ9616641.1 trypsin-like peptidase domain-containing protein [Paenalcaligenes niemegkensis]